MAKKTYGHAVDARGKIQAVDQSLPKHLRGTSENSEGTIKDSLRRRLLDRALGTR